MDGPGVLLVGSARRDFTWVDGAPNAMRETASALAALVVLVSLATVPASAQSEAYTGTHVSFGTSANAVTEYTVDGTAMLSAVEVQSADEAEGSGLVKAGASLSAVTSLDGAGISVAAETSTGATIEADGSASMDAHDNANGVLVVRAGGDSQYVQVTPSDGVEASAAGDDRVTVTAADGVDGSVIAIGDGDVTVNERGDVVARLGEDGQLVFRAYPDGKSDDDGQHERLIADGEAAGEVHVMSEGGETVTDTVDYGSETTVEARQSAQSQVEVTVDRAISDGTVVIMSVSDAAIDPANGVSVAIDGEAAAEAGSYSDLRGALGSDQSKYLVRQSTGAAGSADVLVAVSHFSERTITVSEAEAGPSTDDGTGDDGGTTDATSAPGQPGFGALLAVLSVVATALIAARSG